MIGKPYSGKLNIRFDEGELEIEPLPLRQLSTLLTAGIYGSFLCDGKMHHFMLKI